ncbi:MAG: UDP-N-acetylmuramoyl-L-alanine--D-glutamate ligase, partial [Raoultibacter sp.]
VESVTIAAGDRTPDADACAADYEAQGARVLFDHRVIVEHYDVCIASPGISQFSEFYESAAKASDEIISEVEFAWRESAADSRWVAVTGTNGKTTTTALITHILECAGENAAAVGNIGDTCLEAVMRGGTAIYVAETSSYQLASTDKFAPNVAVLLNITPDHLKWHNTFENYHDAKLKVFANLASLNVARGDAVGTQRLATAVLDATDPSVREVVKRFKSQTPQDRGFSYIPLGAAAGLSANMHEVCGSEHAAYVRDGVLTIEFEGTSFSLLGIDELQLKGMHNVSNALAAASATFALGVDARIIAEALRSFAPLEHRIEPCGVIEGVSFFNDSKATNVDATLQALNAFGDTKPIVLLGGDDKGTDLTELVETATRHCKAVVCFGAAGPRFSEAFAQFKASHSSTDERASLPVYSAPLLESALDEALRHAISGDVIVLSPACASFDEFSSFEERGRIFKDLVTERSTLRGAH